MDFAIHAQLHIKHKDIHITHPVVCLEEGVSGTVNYCLHF